MPSTPIPGLQPQGVAEGFYPSPTAWAQARSLSGSLLLTFWPHLSVSTVGTLIWISGCMYLDPFQSMCSPACINLNISAGICIHGWKSSIVSKTWCNKPCFLLLCHWAVLLFWIFLFNTCRIWIYLCLCWCTGRNPTKKGMWWINSVSIYLWFY